jgi:hypothetical protein
MNSAVIETVGAIFLLIFCMTMMYHGTMILLQRNGYTRRNYRDEAAKMRKRIEEVLKNYGSD